MINVAVLHPSFGRPYKAVDAYVKWMAQCDKPERVEYLVGLDDNDPSVEEYRSAFGSVHNFCGRLEVNVGPSRNVPAAMNRLATRLSDTTELIVATADDQTPCPSWDTELLALLAGNDNFVTPRYIGVSDGVHAYGPILVFIVNRAWYTRLGYLLCPEYDGLCVDNDCREVATRLNAIIHAPYLLFQHHHYSTGACEFDATYARNNNPKSLLRNSEIYDRRAGRNFDL